MGFGVDYRMTTPRNTKPELGIVPGVPSCALSVPLWSLCRAPRQRPQHAQEAQKQMLSKLAVHRNLSAGAGANIFLRFYALFHGMAHAAATLAV